MSYCPVVRSSAPMFLRPPGLSIWMARVCIPGFSELHWPEATMEKRLSKVRHAVSRDRRHSEYIDKGSYSCVVELPAVSGSALNLKPATPQQRLFRQAHGLTLDARQRSFKPPPHHPPIHTYGGKAGSGAVQAHRAQRPCLLGSSQTLRPRLQ